MSKKTLYNSPDEYSREIFIEREKIMRRYNSTRERSIILGLAGATLGSLVCVLGMAGWMENNRVLERHSDLIDDYGRARGAIEQLESFRGNFPVEDRNLYPFEENLITFLNENPASLDSVITEKKAYVKRLEERSGLNISRRTKANSVLEFLTYAGLFATVSSFMYCQRKVSKLKSDENAELKEVR